MNQNLFIKLERKVKSHFPRLMFVRYWCRIRLRIIADIPILEKIASFMNWIAYFIVISFNLALWRHHSELFATGHLFLPNFSFFSCWIFTGFITRFLMNFHVRSTEDYKLSKWSLFLELCYSLPGGKSDSQKYRLVWPDFYQCSSVLLQLLAMWRTRR